MRIKSRTEVVDACDGAFETEVCAFRCNVVTAHSLKKAQTKKSSGCHLCYAL